MSTSILYLNTDTDLPLFPSSFMLLNLSLLHFYEVKDEQVFVPVFTEIYITAKTVQLRMINNINCHSLRPGPLHMLSSFMSLPHIKAVMTSFILGHRDEGWLKDMPGAIQGQVAFGTNSSILPFPLCRRPKS